MNDQWLYNYKAIVTDVYDGDTVTVDIDLGLNVWMRGQKIRLYGINAPEMRGPEKEEGMKSRDWLRDMILDKTVMVRTRKDKTGKYGRWLASIFYDGYNINQKMVALGLAKEYML